MFMRRPYTSFRSSLSHLRLASRRFSSQGGKSPVAWRSDPAAEPVFGQDSFVSATSFSLDVFKRFFKFSLVGLFAVGITSATIYEGAHMWVETVALAREEDQEVRAWEWDLEAEKWSSGDVGGTDPALGSKGRHAVRAAWMAQHWGTGSKAAMISSHTAKGRDQSTSGGLDVVETRLEYAQAYLDTALSVAESKIAQGELRPQTMVELLTRHSDALERIGTPEALSESRSRYERVWAALPAASVYAARTAAKLGDLNSRLGENTDALAWWMKAIQLTQGRRAVQITSVSPSVPLDIPKSPMAQRTLTSTLVALSAFFAKSESLPQAQAVEEATLEMLRSIRPPESLTTATPPQALHALYLLHRSSLISIHLAEVLFALQNPPELSMRWLANAAESSERVALMLTGLPTVHPDAPESNIPHPPVSEALLTSTYYNSRTMRKPASNLLRDARRSAAEAWNLLGILNEDKNPRKSLECYERALGWAGVAADKAGGIGEAGEGILESEWKALWTNYNRARSTVKHT